VIAAAVRLDSRGPALYRQHRHGFNNRVIKVLKFRTMRNDPGAPLRQVCANDPRITRIGAFLRRTSLDELPQLINVLRGEMSLVGPRPVPKAELDDRYGKQRRYYLLMRPGLTGLWQISGRSNTTYEQRIAYDKQYATQWSFKKDIEIIVKTLPAVLKADGAK
jgi:undecaprenyl-phosphate galactose phosphotransferase